MVREADVGVLQQLQHPVELRIALQRKRIVGAEQVATRGKGEAVRHPAEAQVRDVGGVDWGAYSAHQIATGDLLTTNICFGDRDGSGEYRDAYITASGTGKLLHMRWPSHGLRLNNL